MNEKRVSAIVDGAYQRFDQQQPGISWRGIVEPSLLKHDVYYELLNREVSKIGSDATVLDVGCGLAGSPRAVKMEELSRRVGSLWGIEPDASGDVPKHYQRIWRSTLEEADIPDQSVDLLLSYFVIEHVQSPDDFFLHLIRVLKPGGTALAATVNLNCFFARVAKMCQSLGLQDQVLKMIRGRDVVERYHYPAYYLCNTLDVFRSQAKTYSEIEAIDLIYLENDEWFHYLPGPTRILGPGLRHLLHRDPLNHTYLFVLVRKKEQT